MKFIAFIALLVLAVASFVAAKEAAVASTTATSTLGFAISKADVALSQTDLATYGVPPRAYSYSFRKCYYCKYACGVNFPFASQQSQTNHTSCAQQCAAQDFCKEWVQPLYKDQVLPYAVAWHRVTVPVDLALSLKLASAVTAPSGLVTYRPAYVPYPWMCATPVEFVQPEYKPEPAAPVCYVTPSFDTSVFRSPVKALQLYVARKTLKALGLSPFSAHQVVYYGN